jgi:hypothetical protein
MTPSIWKKVAVAVQSALATALDITAISKASPGVVTYTGTDPSNGDYVKLIDIEGMSQLDGRVVRVANVNAGSNTFELEGVDTTLFDTFVSGTCQVITFGTSINTAIGLSASGGDFEFIDTTTIHDDVKSQIPGLANAAVYNFDNFWDPAEGSFTALKNASDNQQQLAFRFTFANGKKVLFNGYVGFSGLPVGQAQDKVTTPLAITMFGKPTYYAS